VTKTRVLGPEKKGSWLRFRDISPKISGKSEGWWNIIPFGQIQCDPFLWGDETWWLDVLVATQFIFSMFIPKLWGRFPCWLIRWVETTKQMQVYGKFESYFHFIMHCFGLVIFHDPCHLPRVFFSTRIFSGTFCCSWIWNPAITSWGW